MGDIDDAALGRQRIIVDQDVPVPMRDGTVLLADVYRPVQGRCPVLLMRHPYGKGTAYPMFDAVRLARRGFAVIIQDVRGRFGSQGAWMPFVAEAEDGHDSVQWAAEQEYASGDVGLMGLSYGGIAALQAAALRPPALRAVAALAACQSPDDGVISRGGAFEWGLQGNWQMLLGLTSMAKPDVLASLLGGPGRWKGVIDAFYDDPDPVYRAWPESHPLLQEPQLGAALRAILDERASGDGAVHRALRIDLDAIEVPVLSVGGWYDIYAQATIDRHERLTHRGIASQLLMGPWTHTMGVYDGWVGQRFSPRGSTVDALRVTPPGDAIADWLAAWLHGDGAPAHARWFTTGAEVWRSGAWPPATTERSYFTDADGGLAASASRASSSTYRHDPSDPVPTVGGNLLTAQKHRWGPRDQREVEERDDVLVFTTEPLAEPITVSGRVRLELVASSDADHADFVARLCDVDATGLSLGVIDGVLRTTMAASEVRLLVDLWSTSHTFAVGHRIRLHVASSSAPRWDLDPARNHGAIHTIRHGREGTRLILPVETSGQDAPDAD